MTNVGDQLTQPESGWQRIDDTDSNIKYIGSWTTNNNSKFYNSTNHYSNVLNDNIKFKFYGTKLRLISDMDTNRNTNGIKLIIDDVEYSFTEYYSRIIYQIIVYEKTDLEEGIHNVEIINTVSGKYVVLDAIDIDEDGYMIALPIEIGDRLTQPEEGWQRIDSNDNNINYRGTEWSIVTNNANYYNSTYYYTSVLNNSIKFKFYGSKLRLISDMDTNRNTNGIKLIIDDVEYSFTEYYSRIIYQIIVYEKTDLEEGIHNVEIINTVSGKYVLLDAIDIDEDGYMITPTRVIGDKLTQPESGWKRIDDSDSNIKYKGAWTTNNDSKFYNSKYHYSTTLNDNIKFKFYGTKLRLISDMNNNRNVDGIKLIIDGTEYSFTEYYRTLRYQRIVFEKLDLEEGIHNVEIINTVAGKYVVLDAIDIDEDGYMIALPIEIGDRLTQPESGWKRIDDTDSNIKYIGSWTTSNDSKFYNSKYHYSTTLNDNIKFRFYGSKLRLISDMDTNRNTNGIKLIIDGTEYSFTEYYSRIIYQIIVYEKTDLEEGIHNVEIINTVAGKYVVLDAIDIDEDGYMIALPIEIGDRLTQPESGWKRIDDTDSNIKYIGSWTTNNNSKFYNSTNHYSNVLNDSIKFSFYGTKLRLISDTHINRNVNGIKLIIDDMEYSFTEYYSTIIYQRIVFEKTDLEEGIHNVKIINIVSGKYTVLDAIDIDEDGYMMAPPIEIDDRVTEPEEGWKRIDDTDSNIKYIGNYWKNNNPTGGYGLYNSSFHKNTYKGSCIIFYVYTSKLRIYDMSYTNNSKEKNHYVYINNELVETYSSYMSVPIGYSGQRLKFEKILSYKQLLYIKIYNNSDDILTLDCIDIDEDGYLLTEEEYEIFLNSNFIKTNNNIISDDTYPLDSNLLELRDNYHGVNVSELTDKIKDINEKYKIVKIKK